VVDFLFVIIELFRCLLRLKSVEVGVFRRSGSLWAQISDGRGVAVSVTKLEWLPFRVVSKYQQRIFWFCHKARVWQTDGRTDMQNYDS